MNFIAAHTINAIKATATILARPAAVAALAAMLVIASTAHGPTAAHAQAAAQDGAPQYVAVEGAVTDFQVRQTQDADQNDQITVTFSDGSADAATHQVPILITRRALRVMRAQAKCRKAM